jgi:transketolase
MGGAMNGMAMHGGVLPVGGTFFVFSDYMRGAVRLAALSQAKVIYSWTHDSVGLGEDGPTHQPIEQIAAMRAMPQLRVIRPADPNEVAHAWRVAVESDGPTALLLTRQAVPVLEGTAGAADGVARGAYVLRGPAPGQAADVVLIGTGSEVSVCLGAADLLAADGISTKVVSMPSWELFELQPDSYRDDVLDGGPRLSVEAAASFGWERWADDSVSIDHFGASAPGAEVLARFGYTPDNVADRARRLLGRPPREDAQ